MTTKDKIARRKLSLLEFAKELSNVSRACKVMGYSRQQFYEIRRNFQTYGAEGLIDRLSGPVAAIWFEEVRRHAGTDASHIYGGLMATLTAWAELRGVPYEGVPVGTIKRHATGKGKAPKEAMIAAARARGFSPADGNEADPIAILLWAIV